MQDLLGAFAFMRQNVGYVQSMSYIAAMFLLYSSGLFFANAPTHSSGSYSDSPFDAFVAFSNVIIRPFFQNYFKRREVCCSKNSKQKFSKSVALCLFCTLTGALTAKAPCF